jgi:hypothetical protein
MKSATLSSFWAAYKTLAEDVQRRARKAYRLWAQNPFHSSLHFKCVNQEENIWSVRIALGYRAIGVFEGDTVTWFWIGGHDDYERFLEAGA